MPTRAQLNWRSAFLSNIDSLIKDSDYHDAPLFEIGNTKIGQSSSYYDKVYVWNLPPVRTCPGASPWCLGHCYNADSRTDKFPIGDWNKNLQFFLNDHEKLTSKLLDVLNRAGKTAVRLHSSGDFFSIEYINFWKHIIDQSPGSYFWAYTRSWTDKDLLPFLETLKSCRNLQLFASWDDSMIKPPADWRKSIVYTELDEKPNGGIVCPEQNGQVLNCAECNYCLAKPKGDVYFKLH